MTQLIWIFKLLSDACVQEIEKRLRPHSHFTAPEAIDSIDLWLREYQASRNTNSLSRLQQVTEILRVHPLLSEFMDAFMLYETTETHESSVHLVWSLENNLKHSGSWTKALTWLIIMCIVHEYLPKSKAFLVWREKHTYGWSKKYVDYV